MTNELIEARELIAELAAEMGSVPATYPFANICGMLSKIHAHQAKWHPHADVNQMELFSYDYYESKIINVTFEAG